MAEVEDEEKEQETGGIASCRVNKAPREKWLWKLTTNGQGKG